MSNMEKSMLKWIEFINYLNEQTDGHAVEMLKWMLDETHITVDVILFKRGIK